MNELLPPVLSRLLKETPELAEAHLVGGCVRDWLLGTPVKDFDIEVFGVRYPQLLRALERWGRVDCVGRSFGVIKLTVAPGETYDFSLPRRDSKVGPGHRGFTVEVDPELTPEEAAARRDFTINALLWNVRQGRLLDPFHGQDDLRAGLLRHTSPAFVEDPLRILRGMQFAARFRLTAVPETLDLCRSIASSHAELAVERIREEWYKWAAQAVEPSAGLRFLRDSGWGIHYPEVTALIGVPQDPEWHPEGDVWIHTLHALDALVRLPAWRDADRSTRIVLSLATLAHDFAKPACTRRELREGRERIISPGHEAAGGPLAETFLTRLQVPLDLIARILPLVTHHLAHLQEPTPRSIRRLAHRLAPSTIQELGTVVTADASGRPPRPPGEPPGWIRLKTMAAQLALSAQSPKPILQGRHLIERGLKPGPEFGTVLAAAFEAQLDGAFADLAGALAWFETHHASRLDSDGTRTTVPENPILHPDAPTPPRTETSS